MKPGSHFVRSWFPSDGKITYFPDTLTIYDRGDIQGFFIQQSSGKTNWIVFQVDYKLMQEAGEVLEGGEILEEFKAPLHYFSIEKYPLKLEQVQKRGGHLLF